jgi:serine/threonine protein kinase
MLNKNPKERISVDDALQHPFITRYSQYIQEIKSEYQPSLELSPKKPRRLSLGAGS